MRVGAELSHETRPGRPDFPEVWSQWPIVMFDKGDPDFESFNWGAPRWATEQAYDKDLADFLARLACDHEVPIAQTHGLALRALASYNRYRLFAPLLAVRLIGPDCPPGKGLPEDMRRALKQLAAELKEEPAADAATEAAPPAPGE